MNQMSHTPIQANAIIWQKHKLLSSVNLLNFHCFWALLHDCKSDMVSSTACFALKSTGKSTVIFDGLACHDWSYKAKFVPTTLN